MENIISVCRVIGRVLKSNHSKNEIRFPMIDFYAERVITTFTQSEYAAPSPPSRPPRARARAPRRDGTRRARTRAVPCVGRLVVARAHVNQRRQRIAVARSPIVTARADPARATSFRATPVDRRRDDPRNTITTGVRARSTGWRWLPGRDAFPGSRG